jgi:hypothetical protein
MGNPNPRPPLLLPQKLLLIREYLEAGPSEVQEMLLNKTNVGLALTDLPKASHVSEYENALRRPSLLLVFAYGRLGRISMESLLDDDVSLEAFRRELGTYDHKQRGARRKKARQGKRVQRKKAVTRNRKKI